MIRLISIFLREERQLVNAIRKRADQKIKEAFLADGTISTEPKNPNKDNW